MLQKNLTVTALGAVFFVLTAVLLVQKTDLGLASTKLNQAQVTSSISDPRSAELFQYEIKANPVKLASAVEAIERKRQEELEAENVRIAALTAKKNERVFIDTINKTLPPVIEPASPDIDPNTETWIRKYAAQYGANSEIMIAIARCESGFNANAVSASGSYKGIYQFVASTWQSNRHEMGMDESPSLMFNPEEAIKTAAFKMGRDGYGAWPVCSQKAFNNLALN